MTISPGPLGVCFLTFVFTPFGFRNNANFCLHTRTSRRIFGHRILGHPPTEILESKQSMAEKVKKLGLQRDYTKYLYFLDKEGNVCQKPKSGDGKTEVVVPNAVERDNQFLYFIDKEGDVSRSPRVSRGSKPKAA
jgi:hypothetical protein